MRCAPGPCLALLLCAVLGTSTAGPLGSAAAAGSTAHAGADGVTSLQIVGEDRSEYVTGGLSYTDDATTATFTAGPVTGAVQLHIERSDGSFFLLNFGPAEDDDLRAGTFYPRTRPSGYAESWLRVSGQGRGCGSSTGAFTVHEIAFVDGGLERLSATFEQRCSLAASPLYGSIAYRASRPAEPVPVAALPIVRPTAGEPGPSDVSGSVHEAAIRFSYSAGLVSGFPDGSFRPDLPVTRGQLATLLTRVLAVPAGPSTGFPDVRGSVHEVAVNALAHREVLLGADGRYRPDEPVTRAQLASVLDRALRPWQTGTDAFGDDDGDDHEQAVNRVAAAGLLRGRPDGTFNPRGPVTRGQAASVLARLRGGH